MTGAQATSHAPTLLTCLPGSCFPNAWRLRPSARAVSTFVPAVRATRTPRTTAPFRAPTPLYGGIHCFMADLGDVTRRRQPGGLATHYHTHTNYSTDVRQTYGCVWDDVNAFLCSVELGGRFSPPTPYRLPLLLAQATTRIRIRLPTPCCVCISNRGRHFAYSKTVGTTDSVLDAPVFAYRLEHMPLLPSTYLRRSPTPAF